MNVQELAHTNTNTINLPYLESSIKTYIKKTNFPKKLVLTKIENEINRIKSIHKEIDEKLIKKQEECDSLDKRLESIKMENTSKITSLLNKLSNSVF